MKYLLLIYDDTSAWEKFSDAQRQQGLELYMRFTNELKSSGKYIASNQLHPASTAASVRQRDGKRLVTDGPYAETKEQLAGFYMVEVQDLDEARGIAERVPSAKWGVVEVRAIVERPAQASA